MINSSNNLSELERKARADALKRIAELFQKPEQLDKIDSTKARFLNQKMATEAQLKMALHSQLDGSKVGLDKLDAALTESQMCGSRIHELASALEGLDSLSLDLNELKNISRKHSQLAAAMQNMSYLVKAPEAMEQARTYIENENILDGHKILQELEGIRNELMSEVHCDTPEDLDTLRTYFVGLGELNTLMQSHITHIGSRLTSAVVTQNRLVVDCARIIDREERADAIWQKRSEKGGFLPDGRPKHWKKVFFDAVARSVQDKVFGSAMDGDTDKNKLVRHNEIIRQYAMADMKIAKNLCPTYFPSDYNVFNRFVEIYHDAIGMHVESLVLEGLTDTEIVQLLGWINAYHTEEFMKEPALNIDFSSLTLRYPINLLPEEKLYNLREQYVSKTVDRLRTWLLKSLSKDASDWQRSEAPELDGSSFYFTNLPVLVMTPVNELIGKGSLLHFLGNSVRERFLVQCVQQMCLFVNDFERQLKQYHVDYVQDRSRFPFYLEYILGNANGAFVIADSFSTVMMQELAEDTQLKGRLLQQINQLKIDYEKIVRTSCQCAQHVILMDLERVLAVIMTPPWLSTSDMTSQYLIGTLADYDDSLVHLRPAAYNILAQQLAERVLLEYLKILFKKRCPLKTDGERRTVGERIMRDGQSLNDFFAEKMKVKTDILKAYDSLSAIAQLFITTDVSMLSLDIVNLERQFPDIRTEQLFTILMARCDLPTTKARELSSDYPGGQEPVMKASPCNIFTKLADNLK